MEDEKYASRPASRLEQLLERLSVLTATIARTEAERSRTREEITRERARLRLENSYEALEPKVTARWETGMTAAEIGRAIGCTTTKVQRIIAACRKRERTNVRRGRDIPERRRLRQ